MIFLDEFPFPPASNHIFTNKAMWTKGGRKVTARRKSDEYLAFEERVTQWAWGRRGSIAPARQRLREWIAQDKNQMLKVDMLLCVPRFASRAERTVGIYTRPKRKADRPGIAIWDASNRIKAAHDSIARVLEVDDSRFTVGLVEKVLIDDDGPPCVVFRISRCDVRTRQRAIDDLTLEVN